VIAADTSTWIAYLQGERSSDTNLLDRALADKQVVMVPVVLAELLSDPKLDVEVARILAGLPLLEIFDGFWERTGRLRAVVHGRRRKARLGDALIAQCCIDHQVGLITRDKDFQAFAEAANLRVVVGAFRSTG
jgi:predicted nucleic acid-binding protein